MLSSEVRVEEEEVLESDACCCFLDGCSEMVELWVAVAQLLAEEHVSNNHRNLMIN